MQWKLNSGMSMDVVTLEQIHRFAREAKLAQKRPKPLVSADSKSIDYSQLQLLL